MCNATARLDPDALATLVGTDGKLGRWPRKRRQRRLALYVLFSKFEQGRDYSEPEVNQIIRENTTLEDYVLLRRELYENFLLDRTRDGTVYRPVDLDRIDPDFLD